jgi:hypothetical protein
MNWLTPISPPVVKGTRIERQQFDPWHLTPAARFSKRTPKVCPRATTVAMAAGVTTSLEPGSAPTPNDEDTSSCDRKVALAPTKSNCRRAVLGCLGRSAKTFQ